MTPNTQKRFLRSFAWCGKSSIGADNYRCRKIISAIVCPRWSTANLKAANPRRSRSDQRRGHHQWRGQNQRRGHERCPGIVVRIGVGVLTGVSWLAAATLPLDMSEGVVAGKEGSARALFFGCAPSTDGALFADRCGCVSDLLLSNSRCSISDRR